MRTQRVSQGAVSVGARGFVQNTWSVNVPPFGGDTLLNLTDPQNPAVLVDGWYLLSFVSGVIDGFAGPIVATPGATWSPQIFAGPLTAESNVYTIAPQADVAIFGPQEAKTVVFGTLHAGTTIQTFIVNGDTAAHTWLSDMYVSLYPPHVQFLN